MTTQDENHTSVVRTERGLTISGARITIYQIMDYLKANWPPGLIRQWLDLTDKQITDVIDYINIHSDEVESEYQSVLTQAEENRKYWEEYNQQRFARIAASHSDNDPVWMKIQARKAALGMK